MKQIGVIKLGALGDVLRTTALLRPLQAAHGVAQMTWVTSQEALPLLQGNPFIHRALSDHPSLTEMLREVEFDLLLSMDDDARTCELASSFRVRCLIGAYRAQDGRFTYTPSSAPWFRMGLLNADVDGRLASANALKQQNTKTYGEIWMGILGLEGSTGHAVCEPILMLSEHERAVAAQFAQQHGLELSPRLVGLNPGAGPRWQAKQLAPERAASLARQLQDQLGATVLLFGGPQEDSRNAQILQWAGAGLIDARTRTVREFAALLDLCHVVVTTDSFALHAATALKKRVIAMVGPTAAQEIDVYGRGVKLPPQPPCRCFYERTCRLRQSCIDQMSLEPIVRLVGRMLDESAGPPVEVGIGSAGMDVLEIRRKR